MSKPTQLQKAGRAFLLRLVAGEGPEEAARVLRSLADEIEGLGRLTDGLGESVGVAIDEGPQSGRRTQ